MITPMKPLFHDSISIEHTKRAIYMSIPYMRGYTKRTLFCAPCLCEQNKALKLFFTILIQMKILKVPYV